MQNELYRCSVECRCLNWWHYYNQDQDIFSLIFSTYFDCNFMIQFESTTQCSDFVYKKLIFSRLFWCCSWSWGIVQLILSHGSKSSAFMVFLIKVHCNLLTTQWKLENEEIIIFALSNRNFQLRADSVSSYLLRLCVSHANTVRRKENQIFFCLEFHLNFHLPPKSPLFQYLSS